MVGNSFTNVFGGQTIYPAQLNFKAIALTANLALSWPAEIATTSDVVANIMRVTPSGAGFSITLDDATLASNGVSLLFSNAGADSFTVKDSTGGTIATIASGLAWDVILRDNATAAGSWMVIQRGAGSSSAQAAALAGPGLIAINDLLATAVTVQERNTDVAFASASRAILYDWTGGSGDATIDNPSSFMSGWWSAFRNDGSGALTITPDAGVIDGSSNKVANPGSAFFIFTDGTDFFTIGGGEVTGAGFDYTSIDISGASGGTYTLSGSELNRIAYNFTGALSGAVEVEVPGTVQEYWCTDATTGGEQVSIRTSIQTPPGIIIPTGETIITYCDGSEVRSASASGISTPIAIADGGTGATTASGARSNLGASASGDAVFTGTAAVGRTALGLGALAVLNTVAAAQIDADAVTTVKILDANVTTPKIADLNVTTGKINDLAVTTGKVAANAVTFGKIQAITDGVLLGASGGTAVEEITVGTGLTLAANTLSVSSAAVPYDYLAGCTMSNSSGTPNTQIDVAAGQAADSTNAASITFAGGTLNLATTGANGLRTGSLANNTNYAVFLISGGSGNALFADTAITPGTRPAGYTTSWRRIGVFRTDGSAHVLLFKQIGRRFWKNAPIEDFGTTTAGVATPSTATLSLLTGKKWPVVIRAWAQRSLAASSAVAIYDPDQSTQAPAQNVAPGSDLVSSFTSGTIAAAESAQFNKVTDLSSQLFVRTSISNTACSIFLEAWDDDGLQ